MKINESDILVVDDDSDDRKLFCGALKQVAPDYLCQTAANGKDGLELLMQDKPVPGLAFVDINMPLMTGWQLLTAINANPLLKNLEIIIFSTSSSDRDRFIADELGATGYCVKPDDPDDLKDVIKHIVESCRLKTNSIPDYKSLFKFFRFRNQHTKN